MKKIPTYYKTSQYWVSFFTDIYTNIFDDTNCKEIFNDEYSKKYSKKYYRENIPISSDDDLIFFLNCAGFWGFDIKQQILLDYISENIIDFDKIKNTLE